jgi:hypothetical protein
MTPQAMKRDLGPGKVSNASQVSQPKRRKLCKQPPKRAHSNTFNDEAIAQAMQNSSQEQEDSPSDLAIALALQEEEGSWLQ